jgi:hypothetical protein
MRAEKWYGQRWTNPKRDLTDGNANLFLDDEDSKRGRGEEKLEGNTLCLEVGILGKMAVQNRWLMVNIM